MGVILCSGPGAFDLMERNQHIGFVHAAIVESVLVVSLILCAVSAPDRRALLVPASLFGLLALHPAWTISAYGGDCGFMKRDVSWIFTVLAGLGLG